VCREAGFEPNVAFEADETLAAQALVAAGVGVTILPQLALTTVHPGVVARRLSDAPVRRIWAARLEGSYASPASEAMVQTLEDVAEEFREARLELAG
jgi:DNA-binding transcriptional LysR family regulator